MRPSRPENGKFANETYFFTGANWRDRPRLSPFGASALILLVSDGAMPFTLAEKFQGLEPRLIAPVTAYLDRVDPNQGARGPGRDAGGFAIWRWRCWWPPCCWGLRPCSWQ